MNYIRGFTDLKDRRQLHQEPGCRKDIKGDKEIWGVVAAGKEPTQLSLFFVLRKAGTFPSSRSARDRARCGVVGMVISEQEFIQKLIACAYKGRQISEFVIFFLNV